MLRTSSADNSRHDQIPGILGSPMKGKARAGSSISLPSPGLAGTGLLCSHASSRGGHRLSCGGGKESVHPSIHPLQHHQLQRPTGREGQALGSHRSACPLATRSRHSHAGQMPSDQLVYRRLQLPSFCMLKSAFYHKLLLFFLSSFFL